MEKKDKIGKDRIKGSEKMEAINYDKDRKKILSKRQEIHQKDRIN